MKQRLLVTLVGGPALVWALVCLPSVCTMLLVVVLSAMATFELLRAVGLDTMSVPSIMAMISAVFICGTSYLNTTNWYQIVGFLFISALFIYQIMTCGSKDSQPFSVLSVTMFAGLILPIMLSSLIHLRLMEHGNVLVLIPLVAAFGSDMLAFCVGITMGKHKLAPHVSPKKTVEGATGGLIGGALGMLIFYFFTKSTVGISWEVAVLLGIFGSVMGQVGDLAFSVIKREFGIKDYGKIFPGHGGVLDRFDSVIFVAPVIWLLLERGLAL